MQLRSLLERPAAAVVAAVVAACGGNDDATTPTPEPLTTGIEVSNQTSGDPIEHDGYTVTVDGDGQALPVNASVLFSDLEPGDHAVELRGVDQDCEVLGANPRTVHTTGGTSSSLFLVRCSVAGTGRIVVETFTYGNGGDGYRVEMDGGRFLDLGLQDEGVFYAVPIGPVTLTLTGAGPGCEVTAPNPRTHQVHEHEQLLSVFKIHCPG
jgi:hypothetical protein